MVLPNSFGTPTLQFGLVDPRCIREHRQRFRRDSFPELDRANSYYSMSGRWPDVGWILLDRASYNQLNPYATNLQLTICDFVNPALTITGLTIVQARCVTRGIASDPNAIYLLQVTNSQGILYNPWFQYPTNSQYNVRAPAYDGDYYSSTLNSGASNAPWTWDAMVGDLWGQAATVIGAYPHLPTIPTGTPENFIFTGTPLWEALNGVLDYVGMAISGPGPFTIVVPGSADPVFSALLTKYTSSLEDSMEYLDAGSGRVPSQVVVYFHRSNQVYGTEETVRYDAPQWQNDPIYSVTVAAPNKFTSAAGTGYIWADFVVRYDMDGNPLAADVTTAAAIAAERTTQYFDKIYRGTQGYLRHIYKGVVPFTTGSLVDGVRWFSTGKLGTSDDKYCGWRTEIIRGYIWEEATFTLTLEGLTGPY